MPASDSTASHHKGRIIWPILALGAILAIHVLVPNGRDALTYQSYTYFLGLIVILYVAVAGILVRLGKLDQVVYKAPLLTLAFLLLGVWDIITLKLDWLHLPYFPAPDKVLSVLIDDWSLLGLSTLHSLRLLGTGYLIGGLAGLVTGILIGWSKQWDYWIGPVLRIIGPIPATAWIPLAMTVFPTSFWASVYLIALAVWFPVTVMTSSGIANVPNSYFEVARTLGADEKYLVFRVAIPAAFPTIFVGMFMGLGMSFLTLIVAEMLGVRAGLGWYINWAQGWAEYAKVYSSLIVIAVIFSSLITLLFRLKDRILVWQRGLIKW